MTYGNHGFWTGDDPAGLDNAGIEFWDPTATGPDETGTVGKGMYRLMDGGAALPAEPVAEDTDAVVRQDEHRHDLRRERRAPVAPTEARNRSPPGAPNAKA